MVEAAMAMENSSGIRATLAQAAGWLGAEAPVDVPFQGVGTDTRTLRPGQLFVALRGPNHDGHDHLAAAQAAGAAAALVSAPRTVALPQLVVADTRLGLGRLAAAWRRQWGGLLAAVTGSNGKTTVKEMLAAILHQAGPVLATRGNLNNDIGVPLTLLRLEPEHRFAVVEMGANHPGEIAYLVGMAAPDAVAVTNASAAHLAGFGSLEGVARAKGEIYGGLADGGTAVINADDPHAALWHELAGARRRLTFALDGEADVAAHWAPHGQGSRITLRLPGGEVGFDLALAGRHNVANACAAAALATALGVAPSAVAAGLAAVRPVAGRLVPRAGRGGARLIDDTYNANPASVRSAIAVLAAASGTRLLVLGDMAELGEAAARLHAEVGLAAREAGIDALFAVGPLSRSATDAFGDGGFHFADREALADAVAARMAPQVTVLVKGSRSAQMERVVAALAAGEVR